MTPEPTSYQTGSESDVLVGEQKQVAGNRGSKYFQIGVIAGAILFGFVCGVFYNKTPVYNKGKVLRKAWCAPEDQFCGNINLGQLTECCNGDPCSNRADPYNWLCSYPTSWCAPDGQYCGTINLGQVTPCCAGICADLSDPYNWKCEPW